MIVSIPGAVWEDFLDPYATTMEAELELPTPRFVKRGRGHSVVYEEVSADVARELAEYLTSRGELLLSNSDPAFDARDRSIYRQAIKAAENIERDLRASTAR